ncbi:hypothetical protein [Shinella sp.]|uniref:phage tail terminator protein n=1 Tax=Shinella sp. TaxID=1870904 RepID=UPI00258F31EE|nr:hypothetical protein [Shinella sp.]MCW5711267.1 hypothetical protein [Shinella sp.]
MLLAVFDRLASHAVGLASVDVAEDLDAIMSGTAPANGACFVVPSRERADPNRLGMGSFRQVVTEQVYVAFVVRHHGDVKGRARAEQFKGFKTAIEGALAGWSHDPYCLPFSLVNGEGTSVGNNVTVYVQTWQSTRNLSASEP